VYAAGILLALLAAVFRPRRGSWRGAADALLFVGTGFGLIVVSVATSMFDHRYSIPAVLLIPMGIALAVNRIVAAARPTKEDVEAAPAPALIARIPTQKTKAAAEHAK
jgi:MFS family permease